MKRKKGKNKICNACGKEYYVKFYLLKSSKFCSRNCQNHKQFTDIYGIHNLVNKFRKEGKLSCIHHGIHNQFYIKKENLSPLCRICLRKANRKWDENHWFRNILRGCKIRAIRKNVEFDINEKFIKELCIKQKNKCALSNIIFIYSKQEKFFSPSIDRINPEYGYTKNNIQIVCRIINTMKTNLQQDNFIELCKLVALSNKKKK